MATMTKKPQPSQPIEPAEPKNDVRVAIPFMATSAFPFVLVKFHPDRRQGRALRCVQDALQQRGARLEDGHWVDGPHDTVRWLLEQIAKGIPVQVLDAI